MALTAIAMVLLLLFAGLALDFGRTHLLRAQFQTALDAAALAGALEVIPMVEIAIPAGYRSQRRAPTPSPASRTTAATGSAHRRRG